MRKIYSARIWEQTKKSGSIWQNECWKRKYFHSHLVKRIDFYNDRIVLSFSSYYAWKCIDDNVNYLFENLIIGKNFFWEGSLKSFNGHCLNENSVENNRCNKSIHLNTLRTYKNEFRWDSPSRFSESFRVATTAMIRFHFSKAIRVAQLLRPGKRVFPFEDAIFLFSAFTRGSESRRSCLRHSRLNRSSR